MQNNLSIKKPIEQAEPKSAHATPVVEKYVEKRKEKAEKQEKTERKYNHKLATDQWRKLEYVIF